jgi:hypothetical protein
VLKNILSLELNMELETLIEILEKSVEKNREIPLTNKHLLNILKLCLKRLERDLYYSDLEGGPF